MKIKPSQLKIGTKLYQYSFPAILEYHIIGINNLVTQDHSEAFYVLECLSCQDHEKCKIAVKFDDFGNIKYSHMINGYDEDEEYREKNEHYHNDQYYWHNTKNQDWFLTKKDARLFIHKSNLDYLEEKIKNLELKIEDSRKEIEKEKDKINALNEES